MIEKNPSLGKQVKDLTLIRCITTDYDRRKLFRLFPNLKTIKTTKAIYAENYTFAQETLDSIALKSQLLYIEDSNQCEMTRSLLTSGLCPNLNTLTLDLASIRISHRDIYPQFMQVPLLKNLTLLHALVTMDDCDVIHCKLPSLQSLKLFECDLMEGAAPADTLPGSKITTLHIKFNHFQQQHAIDWPKYISRKYPNLEHFKYSIDTFRLSTSNLKQLLEQGYPHVLQKLGPQLKSFELVYAEQDGAIFKKLDHFQCRIKDLELHGINQASPYALSESNQSKYVETLSLYRVKPLQFGWLKRMKSLRSLKLYYNDIRDVFASDDSEEENDYYMESIHLSKLLQLCPKRVDSVAIFSSSVTFDTNTDSQFQIKELWLRNVDIRSLNFDRFITKCFPNLHVLKLDFTITEKDASLSFPNHHFSVLGFRLGFYEFDFAITTLNNNKTHFFSKRSKGVCKDYSLFGNEMVPTRKKDFVEGEFINVICGSTTLLYLNNKMAYV
jgi:hypothetical protein